MDPVTVTAPAPETETAAAFLERMGVSPLDVTGVRYDGEEFEKAVDTYCTDPQKLTLVDVRLMTLVDRQLGATARARQLGWVRSETEEERQTGPLPVTQRVFWAWVNRWMSPILATYRYKSNEASSRIDALERRIKELEDRPTLKYAGSHRESEPYQEGALVTKAGSLWLATEPTSRMPGTALSGWRLVVKQGQA